MSTNLGPYSTKLTPYGELQADRDALRDRVRLLEYELVRRDAAEGARLHTVVVEVSEPNQFLLASSQKEVIEEVKERLSLALARHIVKHEMYRIQSRPVGLTLERRFYLVFTGVGVGVEGPADLPKPIVYVKEGK